MQWLRFQKIPLQRNEDWQRVVDAIEDDNKPVLVFPNLIEDYRADHSIQAGSKDRLADEYYRFPVSGIYSIDPKRRYAVGMPVVFDSIEAPLLSEITTHRGVWIVFRGWREDLIGTLEKLEGQLKPLGSTVQLEVQFDEPLFLVQLRLKADDPARD